MRSHTIDQACGLPEGSFQKFIKQQEAYFKELEGKRRERIRAGKPPPSFDGKPPVK